MRDLPGSIITFPELSLRVTLSRSSRNSFGLGGLSTLCSAVIGIITPWPSCLFVAIERRALYPATAANKSRALNRRTTRPQNRRRLGRARSARRPSLSPPDMGISVARRLPRLVWGRLPKQVCRRPSVAAVLAAPVWTKKFWIPCRVPGPNGHSLVGGAAWQRTLEDKGPAALVRRR